MHLTYENVNEAFEEIVKGINSKSLKTRKTDTRNGPVLKIDEPLLLTLKKPRERVLFNQARDANPFFHVYEAMWMLAGRNDVASLKRYASKISDYSDNEPTFNGAYGHRWRHTDNSGLTYSSSVDQLKTLVDHLKEKPESRRAVLQMWNVEDDLLKIDYSKDVCCNLSVMFSIREESIGTHSFDGIPPDPIKVLDMTVTNRSNDLIWGMLGANVVHFSFLQEYMACALGVSVGVYNVFTNDAHIYTENNSGFKPKEWLGEYGTRTMHSPLNYGYGSFYGIYPAVPLFTRQEEHGLFDLEVNNFVTMYGQERYLTDIVFHTPFLADVAQPMMNAYECHKRRDYLQAIGHCDCIVSTDWQVASRLWIERRAVAYKAKGGKV